MRARVSLIEDPEAHNAIGRLSALPLSCLSAAGCG